MASNGGRDMLDRAAVVHRWDCPALAVEAALPEPVLRTSTPRGVGQGETSRTVGVAGQAADGPRCAPPLSTFGIAAIHAVSAAGGPRTARRNSGFASAGDNFSKG
jgi:hypothetical protein